MKIRGTIKGQMIELDSPTGLPTEQRVEIDIRPLDDLPKTGESKAHEADSAKPIKKRKRGTRLSDIYPNVEELDARIATEPQFEFIRQAREHRKKLEKEWGGKLNLSTQWIREDRDR